MTLSRVVVPTAAFVFASTVIVFLYCLYIQKCSPEIAISFTLIHFLLGTIISAAAVKITLLNGLSRSSYAESKVINKPGIDQPAEQEVRNINESLSVLIIDDCELMISFLSETLKSAGYKTSWAHSYKEAMDFLSKQSWDVAIVDLKLPDINGIEFTTTIIAHAKANGFAVTVIGITGDTSPSSKIEFLRAGAAGCLTKPFSVDELLELIERSKS